MAPSETAPTSTQKQLVVLYNESAVTLEHLSILKAWAEVYIVSMKDDAYIRSKEPLTTLPTSNKAADSRSDHFFFHFLFVKIIDLPGGQIHDPLLGRDIPLRFLSVTPSVSNT